MKKLPLGIQSIDKILAKGEYIYVDKTNYIKKLIDAGSPHYFLSRPRRFGKSLFVSTLEEVFKGNKELFRGLQIYNSDYQWAPHPILHFDFSLIESTTPAVLRQGLHETLEDVASCYGLTTSGSSLKSQLKRLVTSLVAKGGNVVVLVDEYDQPIINHLSNLEIAEANREVLRSFFGALKGLDAQIEFTFITGVSKFSQVSVFSGLNNLTDITMEEDYACMLGYTEDEIKKYFSEHVKYLVSKRACNNTQTSEIEILDELRSWYNGYRFSKNPASVYNPFSTLNFMSIGEPKSYWYRTGTPSFLIDQVRKYPQNLVPLSGATASENSLLDISSLDQVDLTALMFQTGYLTIQEYTTSGLYRLGLPNKEVEQAFTESLAKCFADVNPAEAANLQDILASHQITVFFEKLKALFASFPYHLFVQATEATYQSMLLALLKGIGFNARAECSTNLGRVDLEIETSTATYIFECKLDYSANKALSQIKKTKYFEQYLQRDKDVILIGLNFSSKDRNIGEWKAELLSADGQELKEL